MKPLHLLMALLVTISCQTILQGQCEKANAFYDIDTKRLRARIMQGGNLFTDYTAGQFFPKSSDGTIQPPVIASAGLWLGGIDPAGNLVMSAATGRPDGVTDFWPGPLDENGECDEQSCTNWDKVFTVKMTDIQAFLAERHLYVNNPDLAIVKYPTVFGWPGYGNPFFESIHGFALPDYGDNYYNNNPAEFYDLNFDGIYNPLDGDFPEVNTLETLCAIRPSQIAWCIFNDVGAGQTHAISGGRAMHMEIKLCAWTYECDDDPLLSQAIFTHYKLTYKNPNEFIDSLYAGIWVDPRLGCPYDDYISYKEYFEHAFIIYNKDLVDDPDSLCDQSQRLDYTPPMLSVSFAEMMDPEMDHLLYMNNPEINNPPPGTTYPEQPAEYYNYLTGSWRNGSPVNYGQMGYQTENQAVNHVFPDNPKDSTGWSMCTVDVPYGERKIIASNQIGRMGYQYLQEFTFIWMHHSPPTAACNITGATKELSHLRYFYFSDDHSNDCFSPTVFFMNDPLVGVEVFPNPASESIQVWYEQTDVQEIRCYDATGHLIIRLKNPQPGIERLDISALAPGIYTLQLIGEAGMAAKKFVVQRG